MAMPLVFQNAAPELLSTRGILCIKLCGIFYVFGRFTPLRGPLIIVKIFIC